MSDDIESAIEKLAEDADNLSEQLENLRKRYIRRVHPERCCPNCSYIGDEGTQPIACGGNVDPD